jgi:hypothetical protein
MLQICGASPRLYDLIIEATRPQGGASRQGKNQTWLRPLAGRAPGQDLTPDLLIHPQKIQNRVFQSVAVTLPDPLSVIIKSTRLMGILSPFGLKKAIPAEQIFLSNS